MHTVTVSTHLSAAPDQVWSKISDPGTIDAWHPVVASCSLEGDNRLCTLVDGARITERIDELDEANRSYSYRILESPLPLANYRSTIKVEHVDGGCLVEWTSSFEVTAGPAEEMIEVIQGVYEAGMGALRESFGG